MVNCRSQRANRHPQLLSATDGDQSVTQGQVSVGASVSHRWSTVSHSGPGVSQSLGQSQMVNCRSQRANCQSEAQSNCQSQIVTCQSEPLSVTEGQLSVTASVTVSHRYISSSNISIYYLFWRIRYRPLTIAFMWSALNFLAAVQSSSADLKLPAPKSSAINFNRHQRYSGMVQQ